MKVEHTLDRLAHMEKEKELSKVQKLKAEKAKQEILNKGKKEFHASAKVDISSKAKELDQMKKAVKTGEPDNSEKIARLKRLIAENKYKVPAEEVADRMVDEHLKTEVL